MKLLSKYLRLVFCLIFILSIIPLKEIHVFAEPIVPQMQPGGIMIEAEDCFFDDTWSVVDEPDASGGKILQSHSNGRFMNESYTNIPEPAPLRVKVNVTEPGNYSVYFRLLNPSGKSSYYLRFNGLSIYRYNNIAATAFDRNSKYTWLLVSGYRFLPGENTIEICYRHDLAIDNFIITNNAVDLPEGKGEPPHKFTFKEDDARKLIYPLPAVVPPPQRPRLILSPDKIPQVKANLNHERNIAVYKRLLENASKDYDCILDVENELDNTNKNYLDYIEANAFLYAINKDEAAGRKAVNGIINYLETFNVTSGSNGASRNGPYMVFIASLVYDWCYDLISMEQKAEMVNLCILNLGKSEMKWPPIALSGTMGHGEETMLGYMLAFGIATYDEYPYAYNTAAGKFFKESLPTRNLRYEGNYYNHQGETYGSFRSGCDWFLRLMLENLGCENMMTQDQRWNPYQWVYRNTPVGHYLRDGDNTTYPLTKSHSSGTNAFLAANFFNDPYLNNEFYRFYNNGNFDKSQPQVTDSMFLIYNNVDLPIKQREELPLSWYSGNSSGMMTARTGWDEGIDSNTMIVSMKAPEKYFGGHQQRDAGHFYIYYKGPLAIDSGVYTGKQFIDDDGNTVTLIGSNSTHNANYAKQTIAHNCVLIYNPNENTGSLPNNGGQYPADSNAVTAREYDRKASGFGNVLGYDYGEDLNNPSYTYLKGDLTGAYGAKAKKYTRSFMFLNFFDETYPGALIVFDKVTSAKAEFKKYWLLHSQQEPEINGNITTIRNTQFGYNGRMINETILPAMDDLNIKKVGGEGLEYLDIHGKNQKAVPQNEFGDESGKWRIEVTPKTEKQTDYFLNVMQVADNKLNPVPLKSEYYEIGDFLGIKIKDRVVYFGKNDIRNEKDIVIKAEGKENETYIYTVADLKEGRWNILKDGKIIASKDATLEGGVISFSASPGEYTLIKDLDFKEIISKDFNILNNVRPAPSKVYFNHNLIFDSSVKVKDDNGKLYVSLKNFMKKLDDKASVEQNGSDVKITLFDKTSYGRKINYTVGSNSYTIDLYGQGKAPMQSSLADPIKQFDNELYFPVSAIDYGTFLTTADYDNIGKVLRTKCSFKRSDSSNIIVNIDDGSRVRIAAVTASPTDDGVIPEATLDNDILTTYYVYGTDNYIQYELEDVETISNVGIIWGSRGTRKAYFEIFVSEDGENYQSVFNGESEVITEKTAEDKKVFEEFKFSPVKAKYVKLGLYGSSTKEINTILEVKICK